MKNIPSLFGVCLLLVLLVTCEKGNDLLKNYPKNAKLKQVWIYSSLDPKTVVGLQQEYEYDENGRVSKISTPMYMNGKIEGVISYLNYDYNSLGQLSEINEFYNSATDPSGFRNAGKYIHYYSGDGKLEKKTEGTEVGYIRKYFTYEYQDGLLIKIKQYNHDDELERYIENQYDVFRNLVKESTYDSDGNCTTYTTNTYSEFQLNKSDVYAYNGDVHVREILRTYDKNGNLILLESNETGSSFLSSSSSYGLHSVLRYIYD